VRDIVDVVICTLPLDIKYLSPCKTLPVELEVREVLGVARLRSSSARIFIKCSLVTYSEKGDERRKVGNNVDTFLSVHFEDGNGGGEEALVAGDDGQHFGGHKSMEGTYTW
jgi:hypothetical protein